MNELFAVALDLQTFCQARGWQFCFIGGLALQRWSLPRVTEDVDMTLITGFTRDEECAGALLDRFPGRVPDPLEFALRARVVLLRHESGIEMDVALGGLEFEVRTVERASYWESPAGPRLLTCSAEDLVVYKAFASRDQDWVDVGRIISDQRTALNVPQILEDLRPLAALKEDDRIVPRLEGMLTKHNLL